MSLWTRIVSLFEAKTNAALDRFEDPRETLEAAYAKALAALADARRGVVEVMTSEKRLELEAEALRAGGERHTQAARDAAGAGDDAAARRALEREAFVALQRDRLLREIGALHEQRIALESLAERTRRRVELFRTEKLALGARYAAAKAVSLAGAHAAGLSSGMEDVAVMVGRAHEKARDAQARAAALLALAQADDQPLGEAGLIDAARVEARLSALMNAPPRPLSG
jgi:phage shock protein A